jgi:predicted dehydrogenase
VRAVGDNETVGVGFAGLGLVGNAMLEHLASVPRLRVAGVQDANAALAAETAERHGSPWQGERFEDLLALDSVDAVVISTPNVFHIPQAQAALRAGKAVLVQKPLAMFADDARATVELADAAERVLLVDYSYRLLETAEALRQALAEIGTIRAASAVFHNTHGPGGGRVWFLDPALSGGGALMDLGVHLLDMLLWATEPESVQLDRITREVRPGYRVEHAAQADLHLDDIPVNLSVCWNWPRPLTDISVTFEGDEGRVRWRNVDGSFARFRTLRDEQLLVEREVPLRLNTLRAFGATLERGTGPPIDTRVYDLLDRAYGRRGA